MIKDLLFFFGCQFHDWQDNFDEYLCATVHEHECDWVRNATCLLHDEDPLVFSEKG